MKRLGLIEALETVERATDILLLENLVKVSGSCSCSSSLAGESTLGLSRA
jgi:hypothetical protein